jgi:hypothetical protein
MIKCINRNNKPFDNIGNHLKHDIFEYSFSNLFQKKMSKKRGTLNEKKDE